MWFERSGCRQEKADVDGCWLMLMAGRGMSTGVLYRDKSSEHELAVTNRSLNDDLAQTGGHDASVCAWCFACCF